MAHPTVAVLGGTGQQGRGIARRLARAGYPILVGSRDPGRAASAIETWGVPGSFAAMPYAEAAAGARVVVLSVPFQSLDALLAELTPHFVSGALVVDVTVPLAFEAGRVTLVPVPEGSAAEHVKARLPSSVRLAAAFKTLPAHLLQTLDAPLDCDEFVCGDSNDARMDATALVTAMDGLRAIDVGPLTRARSIEQLTLLAIAINRRHKRHDARFKVVGL